MAASAGTSVGWNGKLASLPRTKNTCSPTPAPSESAATMTRPRDSRADDIGCTSRSVTPISVSFLLLRTTLPMTLPSCIQSSISISSTIPTMAASTGQSFIPEAMRAELPPTMSTVSPNPASTVSTATRYVPSGLPLGSMGRAISSLLLTSRGSLRVATTVPTTFARINCLRPDAGLADRQCVFEIRMRPRNHVHRHQLTHPAGRCRARVGCRLHGGHIAPDDRGHIPGADLFPSDQRHLGSLHHCIRRLDHRDESFGFDHAERLTHADLPIEP